MKKTLLILTLVLTTFIHAFAQSSHRPIEIKRKGGGLQFYQQEKRLNMNQVTDIMRYNEEAFTAIKKAKSAQTWASVVSGIGGFMIGWQLGALVGGGVPNWGMAGLGAGVVVASIPISQGFNKQAAIAVDSYNKGLESNSFCHKRELKLQTTPNGIGLALCF